MGVRTLIAIGGGEIRSRSTLEIDREVAALAKIRAGERRAVATFVGAASHDSMPYFNSFRKTYTSVFDIKAEVALTVYGEMDYQKIASKFEIADCIYIGGGDTKFLLEHLESRGILPLILQAYERGVIIAGLSAGAICWFDSMYSDYDIIRGADNQYKIMNGMAVISGLACPHYNLRQAEFDDIFLKNNFARGYGIEDNAALKIIDGQIVGAITSGGKAYELENVAGKLVKREIGVL